MSSEDIALDMILHEGRECRTIVEKASFASCPPDMKRVYLFLVNSSIASLKQGQRKSIINFLGGGGLGLGIATAIEIFGRFRGWW
jgi:hypothetical protein